MGLAFVERTADFHAVARVAGEQTLAEGDLADGAVLPFALTLPADAPPTVATANARIGWEPRARADRPGPDAVVDHPRRAAAGLHCPREPGEVAEWLKALAC